MARKSSSHQSGSHRESDDTDSPQPIMEPETSNERFQHIKIPIIEAETDNQHQDAGDYPKVYEENNEEPPQPSSDEFLAPSREFEAPDYKPPSSGEIFDEDTYQRIVNSVKIPNVKFSGAEKDDLQIQDDAPEIPPELVDIKIPTSIPKPNVKIKRKPKRKKKPRPPESEEIKKPKKPRVKVKKTRNPDQVKEYTQAIDNSNPKEEVIIIKPVRKKKPKSVYFNDDFSPDFQFPQTQTRPKARIPIQFYPKPTLKRKPKKINLVIQNRKKKPLLITHQNGDVIYWYPSKPVPPRNNKYVCKRTRFSNQCVNLAQRRPVTSVHRMPKLNSYTFAKATKPTPYYFDNNDKDSLYYYKVIKSPKKKKTIPGGLIQLSQSLFKDDNEEIGSFFKEIDDQGDDGIDEPEAENHEDERITDEEVENDKTTTDDNDDEEEEEGGGDNEEQAQQETPQEVVYDEPEAVDYP